MKKYPYTYEDSPECWDDLDLETQTMLCDWIGLNICPRKTANENHTSYGLKHIFQSDTGRYVYNGQFKAAMLQCGYPAVDESEQNWTYCISERSPAFDHPRPKPFRLARHFSIQAKTV